MVGTNKGYVLSNFTLLREDRHYEWANRLVREYNYTFLQGKEGSIHIGYNKEFIPYLIWLGHGPDNWATLKRIESPDCPELFDELALIKSRYRLQELKGQIDAEQYHKLYQVAFPKRYTNGPKPKIINPR